MNDRIIVSLILLTLITVFPVLASSDKLTTASALYSQSVDLANDGKYQQALQKADEALALNATSINHLIQANRAGILVVLGRYDEAIVAADAALAVEGNLTATHAAAFYNKGDALRHLGRTDEAEIAFGNAHALDNALTSPGPLTRTPATAPKKSPLPAGIAIAGIIAGISLLTACRNKNTDNR